MKDSAHEQAAVGAAGDSEVLRRRVLLVDKIAGCGEPVVEDILLLFEHALFVPAFAVLAATSHVGDREVSTLLEPPGPCGIPRRRFAEVEAAIPCH